MAKQRFGINDAYRGTVGTVIGYEWRGKWCLRARPLRVRNPRTEKQQINRMVFKQAVDLASHMKLALRKGLHNVSMGLHLTECNLFFKRNKGCFSLGEDGKLEVDWESLMLSEGSLAAPVFSTHSSVSPSRAASSPSLGEQPVSNIAGSDGDSGSGSPSKLEGVDAKRTGACVFYPVSISTDRREAVVEECVRNERYITFPFAPCGEGEKACGDDEVYVYAYCPEAAEGVLSAPAWRRGGSVRLTLPERWQGMEVHFYGFAVDLDGEASETVYIGKLERVETRPAMSDTRPRQPQAAATPSLPGSAGDMACDRRGASLEGELSNSHPASLMHSSLEEGTAQEAFIDGWHNICRSDYVINEKQLQLWQIRKNSKTLSSTFIPTWPREPIAISSLSVTLPLR